MHKSDILMKLRFHREDPSGFLYNLYKLDLFEKGKFQDLIEQINLIKLHNHGKDAISREGAGLLFEIHSIVQSILCDVEAGKYNLNIKREEFFDYWEKLNFAIQDFFDDVTR